MLIWLASYPRSGNSLFRIILKELYGLYSATLYDHPDEPDVRKMREIVGEVRLPAPLQQMAASGEIHFVKTHELPSEDGVPAVCLVRDGRDALVSYAHFALATEAQRRNPSPDEVLRVLHSMVATNDYFGGWGPHVLAWTQRRTDTVFVRYEDLIRRPGPVVQQVLHRFGHAVRPDESRSLPSFEELNRVFPWFFRKGAPGEWRTAMPEDLQQVFWARYGEAMRAFGYSEAGLAAGAWPMAARCLGVETPSPLPPATLG